MAQHDYVIANGTGAAVRSDLNNGLAAIVSNNSGATEPTTMYAYQWWADTTTGLLKIRNAANSAWVTVGTLASANLGLLPLAGGTMTGVLAVTAGTAALPGIAVSGDLNTGLFSPGADTLALVTGGTNRVHITSGGLVGIGTTGPGTELHVAASSGYAELRLAGASGSGAAVEFYNSATQLGDIFIDPSNNMIFRNASEAFRVDSSRRLLVGTTSTTGLATNTAPVLAGNFASFTGSTSASNSTATTLVAMPDLNANYLVNALVSNTADASNYNCCYFVGTNANNNAVISAIRAGGVLTLSLSGMNLQGTQNSGNTKSVSKQT